MKDNTELREIYLSGKRLRSILKGKKAQNTNFPQSNNFSRNSREYQVSNKISRNSGYPEIEPSQYVPFLLFEQFPFRYQLYYIMRRSKIPAISADFFIMYLY